MAPVAPQNYLLYIVTIACCCGVTVWQVLSSPLDSFIPHQPRVDNSTFANVDELFTFHFHMDVAVDFDSKSIAGSITHDFMTVAMTDKVVLDIWDMDISSVEMMPANAAQAMRDGLEVQPLAKLDFKTYELNPVIGQTLVVQLQGLAVPNAIESIRINYSTQPTSMALSWMSPEQTAGKKLPYLFSQCESINCRSVAPLQDTPAIKSTYSASVTAKKEFVVKMSANDTDVKALNDTHTQSSFRCDVRIPSYLMAIVVGDLEYRSLGRRVGVITEPSQMDKVANELDTLETLLDTAEEYLTDYIWGNYTVVVLPPSFPFGGMENPLLTFASPTIIVGDKSQVYVATHEIAHSWTGNDVTCRDWENFWLNEGFTVFSERKVSGILHGKDFAKVEALLGNSTLWQDMNTYGLDSTYASIHPILEGDSPDNAFSNVPYEKGFQLLTYLESLIGEDLFQKFLQTYILKFSQQSITTIELRQTWESFIHDNFEGAKVNQILSEVDWETWLYKSELAPVPLDFETDMSREAVSLALEYIQLSGKSSPEDKDQYFQFDSNLKTIFHTTLLENASQVTLPILSLVDSDFGVTADLNPEVKQRWLPLGLSKMYDPAYDASHEFVSFQGRLKYLTPVYQSLQQTGQHDLAVEWFDENKDFYHPIAVSSLEATLDLQSTDHERMNVFELKVKSSEKNPRFRM